MCSGIALAVARRREERERGNAVSAQVEHLGAVLACLAAVTSATAAAAAAADVVDAASRIASREAAASASLLVREIL